MNGSLLFGYLFNPQSSLDATFGYQHAGSWNTPSLETKKFVYTGQSIDAKTGSQLDTNSVHGNGFNGKIYVELNVYYNTKNENLL